MRKESAKAELQQRLQGVLGELEKLTDQIRATGDLSESSELILCLRELVKEQVEVRSYESTGSSAHAAR